MRTSRRGFFAAIAAAVAGATLDPERLLWMPGRKVISIPKMVGNRILPPYMITNEMLEVLRNRLTIGTGYYRAIQKEGRLDRDFIVGNTFNIRRPMRFLP